MSDKARNIYDKIINSKVASVEELGTPEMFTQYVSSPDNASKIYQKLLSKGLSEVELGTQDMFVSAIVPKSNIDVKASTAQSPSATITNTGIKAQEQTNSNESSAKKQGGEKEDWWIQDLGDKLNQGSANIFGGVLGWLGEGEDVINKGISNAVTSITGKEYAIQPQTGWFKQAANYFKQDAERSGQAVNRFDGKSIGEQFDDKEYGALASQLLLEGASSLPTSIGMMIAPQVFVPTTIASSSNLKYDELKEREDLSTTAKLTNAVTTGLIEVATERLGSIPVGGWLKSLYFKGAETGTKVFKKTLMDEVTKLYKRYGLLLAPVGEGVEEAVGQAGENFTNWVTGVTNELNLTKGIAEVFAFGVGGGAYFTAMGVPGTISNEVQRNKIERSTKGYLDEVLSYTKEGGLAEDIVKRVVSNSKNNTIEKTLEGTENAIQLIKEENGFEDVDLSDIREKLLATVYGTRKLHQYYDRQSDADLLLDYYKDKAKNDIINLADEDGNLTKVTLSDGRVVDVVSGKVKVNENGQINFEESSPTLIVSDKSGKRIPVQTNGSALRVESLVSQTPAQQEVENVTSVLQQKYEMETKYPVGTVVYVTDEQGNIKQNEDGTNQSSTIKDHSEDGVIIDTDQGEINLPFALAKNSLLTESDVKERLHTTFTPDTEVKSGNGEGFLYIKGIKDAASNTYEVSMYDNNREFVDTVEMSGKDIYEFGKNKMTEISTQNEDIQPAEDSKTTEEGEFEQKIEQITFPTKKEGGYDFAQFTPEHHYLFAAKTEGDKVANQDLKTAVYAALGNIQKQQDKINKAPFEKKAALRAELLLIKAKYNELKALEDKYIPKEEAKQGETEDIPTQQKASEQSEETQAPVINEQINKQAVHVTENVKQRKQKKLNKTQQQASEIEISPSDIRANVMMYFINGGKINKSVLQQIFGSKGQNAKSIESERRLRISMLTKNENTLDSVSHQIWENMDGYERGIDTSDIRNELEYVISSYNSPVQIAKDLIESYKEKEQQVPDDLSVTDDIMTSDYESEFAEEAIKEIYDLCDDDQINAIFSDTYFHNEDGSINFEKLLSSLETDKVFFTNFPYELSEEQYQNIINIIRQNYDNTKTDIGRVQEKTETNNNSQSDSEGNNGIRGTGSNETRNSEQPLKESIQEQAKNIRNLDDAKKADIERRRQEELSNLSSENLSIMASDYLLNGGIGSILSSDYFIQGLLGSFTNASNKISAIRQKYANEVISKYGDLSNFIDTELYNNMMQEIRNAIQTSYNTTEALEIFDTILQTPTGVPVKLGTQLSIQLDAINNTAAQINAKYDAELQALEEQTKVEVEQPIKKTDKEQASKEDKRTSDEKALDESVLSQAHNNNPTEKQKETGVYDKARINVQGYNITLETLKGQERKGIDSNGKAWAITMNNHYGELDGTIGYDGDAIDVFVGPNPKQGQIFVIDQLSNNGTFDESKVMLGFDTAEEAKDAYMSNYEEGWQGFGSITPAGDNFKAWLYDGKKQRKPFAEYKETPAPVENSINIAESIKTDAKEIKRQELIEERKQRILSEGTSFDKKFGLIPVSEIKNASEIQANIEKIIATLKENEGNKKLDSFEGFAYGGKYAKNAGEQIKQYLISIDVLPLDIRKEFAENIGVTNNDELVSWGEKKYNKLNQSEQPLSVEEKIKPVEKIEDFGEKIEGARKDQLRKYYNKINLNGLTLSTIFPKPDIKTLLQDGLTVRQVSAIKVVYEIAEQQKKQYRNNKAKQLGGIKLCAAYAKTAIAENLNIDFTNEGWEFTDHGKRFIELRVAAYEAVAKELGSDYLNIDLNKVMIREADKSGRTQYFNGGEAINDVNYIVQYYVNATKYCATLEEAITEFVKQVKDNTKTDVVEYKRKLNIYYDRNDRTNHYIGYQPSGKPLIKLKEGFKTAREAFDYKKENEAELQSILERIMLANKEENKKPVTRLKYTNETARDRVGKDWREGKDITTENFANTFGFRGVEYGNWVNQKERQVFLNNTYDSLMDLAQIIGVTPRAISLNGKLALSFGSRGSGGVSAHYEPERVIINLTKTKGLGSLAHEWFHSVDNYFADFKVSMTSMKSAVNAEFKEGTRPEVKQAFKDLHNAFDGAYRQRSRMLDMNKSKIYFNLPHEIAARAFENYMLTKTSEAGQVNDFLANYVSPEEWKGSIQEYPYPMLEESKAIAQAFDNLFEVIQEDNNGVLFQTTDKLIEPATEQEVAETVEQLLKTGLAKEVRMVTPEEIAGILEGNEQLHAVYHGSPHSFDQFSLDHIGTGEGNQAFGWGLYFTDKRAIAEDYAKNLGKQKLKQQYRGEDVIPQSPLDSAAGIINDYQQRYNTIPKAIKRAEELKTYVDSDNTKMIKYWDDVIDWLRHSKISDFKRVPSKVLYTIELHEGKDQSEYDYLRWDKEITKEQLDKIESGLSKINPDYDWEVIGLDYMDMTNATGEEIYQALARYFEDFTDSPNELPKEASLFLLRAGIDGIKYPSNFTTGKSNETDFNYVVFDPRAITIKEKVQFMRTPTGTIYGFVKNGIVYLNGNTPNLNTPIHEFGHLWIDAIEGSELYNRGAELVKETPYWERVNADPNYSHLSENARVKEAMAMAIGDKGESVKRNLALFVHIKKWIADVWKRIGAKFGIQNLTPEQIQNLTFNDFVEVAVSELLSGEKLAPKPTKGGSIPATIDVDGIQRPTTNSNGKPIHSTEEGIRDFWRWFGDSKVVDNEGKPLVVYHGTTKDFDSFEQGYEGGMFFTEIRSIASAYSENIRNGKLVFHKNESGYNGANVIPVYLSLQNPFEIDFYGQTVQRLRPRINSAKNKGFDSAIIKRGKDFQDYGGNFEQYVAFEPTQIKSATGNNGEFDGENANILFEPQQLFIDFTKNETQDETRKAHGSEKKQQESVIETINNATLLPTNGAIASVSRHTSKRRSIVSSKRTVIDGFRESGYVNFNGIQVNTHQDIADLWSVHRSPYIEKTHIILLKDGVVVGTMAHTAGKIDTAPIASVNEITDYAAQLGATQIYMLHNHPSGNPTPSLQDVKVTYHIAERLREYGISLLGQVVVDHDKYSFIDTTNKPLIENLNESSLKYALDNNTEYHEYKSEKTDFLLERELVGRIDPQQWLFGYGKKLLSQPEYKAVVVYLSTDQSGKGFVVSAYDALAENTSKEEILSIINEGLNENIGRHAVIIHDGSIKGGFGKVHAKLLDIISIQTGGFANDFVNEEVSYGEKQALWIGEQQNYQYSNEERALAYKDKVKQGVKQEMLNATLSYPEYVEMDHVEEPNIIPERPVYVKGESAYEYMQKLKEYEDDLHAVDSGIKEAYQEALASTYSKTQQLKRAHIDEVSPIEQLNDFIRKQGGEINADADAYIDYFNSKGRATYFTTKFDTEYMQKLVDTFVQVRKSGELDVISARWTDTRRNLSNYEKMHVYLQAKDIEEGIALGLVDRGESGFVNSIGITHAEYITMFENSVSKEHIDAMWKAVNNATRFSLDYQLNADMISKETYDKFTKRQYYVPQREWSERERDERPLDYVKRGGGDNPFNSALRKAKGRKSLASDPLPFIQSIAHSSILSAEKNKTKQAMLKTVKANIAIGRKTGAFDFKQSWLINSKTTDADGNMLYDIVYALPSSELFAEDRETRKEINKLTKQMLEETDIDVIDKLNEKIEELKRNINIATFEVNDNYIRNRTSEEKKQHEVVVISNGDRFVIQYQDEKVANAINRNFNKQTYDNVVMRALNKGTRYMSGILTQYNPVFALWNFARDYQTAIISHAVDFGAEYEAQFLKNTIISQKAINDYVWKGKFTNSKTGKDLELFFETGAATGWSYLFRVEQLKRKLKNQIDPSVIRSIYNGTTLPFTVMAKAFSNITEVSELSTRFATFKTSIERGYSPEEAASHAKEVTVNFDRSGSSKFFSGIFAFFNAQIQGTNKQYRQLTRTKMGKYAIPAVAFSFFIGGVVNALLSPDDPDEERAWAEYDRMNNMLVGNVKIPLTHFYRTFWGMGTQAVLAYKGEKSVEVAMFDGTSNMLSDLFPQTPLSLWELLDENKATGKLEPDLRKYLQTIAPTATVPMVDVMLNKNFTGAPVAREPFSTKAKEYIPDSQLYNRNVHAFFKGATDAWFTKHGGDITAKTKGNVPWYGDINPSKVQHIAEGYTGGVGKQLLDLTNFIYGIAKEGAFDETKIPVWNRLVKPYREDKVVAQKYWTLKNKVEYYEQSYNAYRKARAEGSSLSDEKVQQMRDSEKHQLYLEAKTKLHQMDRMMKSERVPSSQDIKELDAYIKQWNKLK